MLRAIFALPVLFASAAMAFSELPDSSGRRLGLDSLARKVDSLEASLTRLRFELQDRSPYVNGAALNWGRGLGAGVRLHQFGGDIELRYTFRNGIEPNAGIRKSRTFNWSIITGMRRVSDPDSPPENKFARYGTTQGGFVGFRMSTPIFLNYTSVQFGPDLFWPDVRRTRIPSGSGSLQIQFWMTKVLHLNMGTFSDVEYRNHNLQLYLFHPYMGFTVYLFQPRDKSAVNVK